MPAYFLKNHFQILRFTLYFLYREMTRRIRGPLFAPVPEMAATHLEVEGFLNASSAHRMAATHLEVTMNDNANPQKGEI